VYEEWDTTIHRVTRAQLIEWCILTKDGSIDRKSVARVVAGVDWGWTNPGTIQVYAQDHDGRLYLIYEVYQTQRTDDWWVERGKELKGRFGIELWICDPAMPAYITKFKMAGLNAVEADNDISVGINDARELLQKAGDGRPRFYLYEYSLADRDEARVDARQPFCFDGEILEYVWPKAQDGKPIKEVPVKLNDHSMDAWRYVCRFLADPANIMAAQHVANVQRRVELQQQRVLAPAQGKMALPEKKKAWWE